MADKKRKATAVERPVKKSRKYAKDSETVVDSTPVEAVSAPVTIQKRPTRKRAADFLDGNAPVPAPAAVPADEVEQAKKESKRARNGTEEKTKTKTKKSDTVQLAKASQIDAGASSDSEVEIATEPASDEDSDHEPDDQGAALLAGFDSDSDDPQQDQGLDLSKTAPLPDSEQTKKKLRDAATKPNKGPGTVYIGRIPHGFYEKQMREYFSQFGDIRQLRLSRNKRTGASKHFAFIEFEEDEVARIVAQTMDTYLLFGHTLRCKYAPAENLHPDVWKGANKKFRKIPHQKLERQKLDAPKTASQWVKKNKKEQAKRNKQAEKLRAIGYEYVAPELKDPYTAIKEKQAQQAIESSDTAEPANGTGQDSSVTPAALLTGPEGEDDAGAATKTKKSKRVTKSGTAGVSPLTEGNLDEQNAALPSKQASGKVSKRSRSVSKSGPTSSTAAGPGTVTSSKATKSDHGVYDQLSSIPMGEDFMAGTVISAVDAIDAAEGTSTEELNTTAGIADAELKSRKKDRKSKAKAEASGKKHTAATSTPAAASKKSRSKTDTVLAIADADEAEAEVAVENIAPAAAAAAADKAKTKSRSKGKEQEVPPKVTKSQSKPKGILKKR